MNITSVNFSFISSLHFRSVLLFLLFFLLHSSSPLCRECFVEREAGESAEQRIARAIRVGARWYSDHLRSCFQSAAAQRSAGASASPVLVLLSDDPVLRQSALELEHISLSLSSLFMCFHVSVM